MSKKATRWAWIVALVALTGGGLVLAFLLVTATSSRFYEQHFTALFWVNVVIAALLVLVIVLASGRLAMRLFRRKFGSRLLLKLAAIFAFVGVLPGVLIYTVSYQFVSRSIESWFDVSVEGALEAGLNLGRSTLDTLTLDLATKTRLAAERLADNATASQPITLERLREQLGVQGVALVDETGQAVTNVGVGGGEGLRVDAAIGGADRPTAAMLRQARNSAVVAVVEGLDDDAGTATGVHARIRALAWVPATTLSLAAHDRYLLVTQILPTDLAVNALAVQRAFGEYQQRSLARGGLRKMYIGTLTLALILAVFGALLLAAALGQQLARPLLLLAEGMDEVAHGDLRPKAVFASRDELGGLTRAFAAMTQQLADARTLADRSVGELEAARANLQTILDSLTAGVIVFDAAGNIDVVNPGATRILRRPLSAYRGRTLEAVPGLAELGRAVRERFELHASEPEHGERDHWQESYDLQTDAAQEPLTLLVRGARLPRHARLMVFDDITEVVSAQRAEAWSEVARRLAHEIKNPLTPIQLSAERLQFKLEAKLEGADQQLLVKAVTTIVNQVQAMKQLVNEFRDYARLPTAKLAPLDLNVVVADVLALYGAEQEAGRLAAECGPGLPWIMGDPTLLRQVIHNLVQNALDAVAERADGRVTLRTALKRDEQGAPRSVRLVVVDNGPGFTDKLLKRAFEPYVTTKAKGTGLGLAVVKKIADEHGAIVRLSNQHTNTTDPNAVSGAQVSLSFSKLAPSPE
ncbi:ATP-binding protein [Aquabacterium sp.]|uniref:sensor histidine kinase n=1 Tax=Aquabacterium sp. TaxID=1872578 RepID=UPI0035B27483